MNLKVDVIESEEGPGYGAAILAAVGCGAYESVEAPTEKLVKVVDIVEPTQELVAKYEERYQKFRKILSGNERIISGISEIGKREELKKGSSFAVLVCPAKLDHTCRCKSGHGNRQ